MIPITRPNIAKTSTVPSPIVDAETLPMAKEGAYTLEPLCDLKMIKADYRLVGQDEREPYYCFRIRVLPHDQEVRFDVSEKNGELFAAELETLAAIIRSRVIRARLIGEETN